MPNARPIVTAIMGNANGKLNVAADKSYSLLAPGVAPAAGTLDYLAKSLNSYADAIEDYENTLRQQKSEITTRKDQGTIKTVRGAANQGKAAARGTGRFLLKGAVNIAAAVGTLGLMNVAMMHSSSRNQFGGGKTGDTRSPGRRFLDWATPKTSALDPRSGDAAAVASTLHTHLGNVPQKQQELAKKHQAAETAIEAAAVAAVITQQEQDDLQRRLQQLEAQEAKHHQSAMRDLMGTFALATYQELAREFDRATGSKAEDEKFESGVDGWEDSNKLKPEESFSVGFVKVNAQYDNGRLTSASFTSRSGSFLFKDLGRRARELKAADAIIDGYQAGELDKMQQQGDNYNPTRITLKGPRHVQLHFMEKFADGYPPMRVRSLDGKLTEQDIENGKKLREKAADALAKKAGIGLGEVKQKKLKELAKKKTSELSDAQESELAELREEQAAARSALGIALDPTRANAAELLGEGKAKRLLDLQRRVLTADSDNTLEHLRDGIPNTIPSFIELIGEVIMDVANSPKQLKALQTTYNNALKEGSEAEKSLKQITDSDIQATQNASAVQRADGVARLKAKIAGNTVNLMRVKAVTLDPAMQAKALIVNNARLDGFLVKAASKLAIPAGADDTSKAQRQQILRVVQAHLYDIAAENADSNPVVSDAYKQAAEQLTINDANIANQASCKAHIVHVMKIALNIQKPYTLGREAANKMAADNTKPLHDINSQDMQQLQRSHNAVDAEINTVVTAAQANGLADNPAARQKFLKGFTAQSGIRVDASKNDTVDNMKAELKTKVKDDLQAKIKTFAFQAGRSAATALNAAGQPLHQLDTETDMQALAGRLVNVGAHVGTEINYANLADNSEARRAFLNGFSSESGMLVDNTKANTTAEMATELKTQIGDELTQTITQVGISGIRAPFNELEKVDGRRSLSRFENSNDQRFQDLRDLIDQIPNAQFGEIKDDICLRLGLDSNTVNDKDDLKKEVKNELINRLADKSQQHKPQRRVKPRPAGYVELDDGPDLADVGDDLDDDALQEDVPTQITKAGASSTSSKAEGIELKRMKKSQADSDEDSKRTEEDEEPGKKAPSSRP